MTISAKLLTFPAAMVALAVLPAALSAETRNVISLDGTWEIAEGSMQTPPASFAHHVPVPGLVDLATPSFPDVGKKSDRRQAFWYRRSFKVAGPIPPTALLKIHKAKFGTQVWLNGKHVGDHNPCFTPGLFDVRQHLKGSGQTNELLIRVGACKDAVAESIPAGQDFEKNPLLPGNLRLRRTYPHRLPIHRPPSNRAGHRKQHRPRRRSHPKRRPRYPNHNHLQGPRAVLLHPRRGRAVRPPFASKPATNKLAT